MVTRLDERTRHIETKIDKIADAVLGPDGAQHQGLSHRVSNLEASDAERKQTARRVSNVAWAALTAAVLASIKTILLFVTGKN